MTDFFMLTFTLLLGEVVVFRELWRIVMSDQRWRVFASGRDPHARPDARSLVALGLLLLGCSQSPPPAPPPVEPAPGPDQIGVRIVNLTDGAPLVWLDPGPMHYRIGVVPPDTTATLFFPAEWLANATGIVRAYPLPYLCYFETTVRRDDAGRVVALSLPEEDAWPAPPLVTDTAAAGPCDRSDVPPGAERLEAMRAVQRK